MGKPWEKYAPGQSAASVPAPQGNVVAGPWSKYSSKQSTFREPAKSNYDDMAASPQRSVVGQAPQWSAEAPIIPGGSIQDEGRAAFKSGMTKMGVKEGGRQNQNSDVLGGLGDLLKSANYSVRDWWMHTSDKDKENLVASLPIEATGTGAIARLSDHIGQKTGNDFLIDKSGNFKTDENYDPVAELEMYLVNAGSWSTRNAAGNVLNPRKAPARIGPMLPAMRQALAKPILGEFAPAAADVATNMTMGLSDAAAAGVRGVTGLINDLKPRRPATPTSQPAPAATGAPPAAPQAGAGVPTTPVAAAANVAPPAGNLQPVTTPPGGPVSRDYAGLHPKVRSAVNRLLENSGVEPARIPAIISNLDQLPPDKSEMVVTELIRKFGAGDPKLETNIEKVGRDFTVNTPTGKGDDAQAVVRGNIRKMLDEQGPILEKSAADRFGPGAVATKEAIDAEVNQIRSVYRRILDPKKPYGNVTAPAKRREIDAAREELKGYLKGPDVAASIPGWVRQDAINTLNRDLRAGGYQPIQKSGMTDFEWAEIVDAYPTQIAHSLQSSFATAGREASKSMDMQGKALARDLYEKRGRSRIRANAANPDDRGFGLLYMLEQAVPKYRDTRIQFGHEMGARDALTLPERFLSIADDEDKLNQFLDDLDELTPAQFDAAKSQITSVVRNAMSKKIENPSLSDVGAGNRGVSTPNLTQLSKRGVLDALEKAFGTDGKKLADDIRLSRAKTNLLTKIEPDFGPRTASNIKDAESAPKLYEDPTATGASVVDQVGAGLGGLGLGFGAMGNIPAAAGVLSLAGARAIWQAIKNGRKLSPEQRTQFARFLFELRRAEADVPAPRISGPPNPPSGPPKPSSSALISTDAGDAGKAKKSALVEPPEKMGLFPSKQPLPMDERGPVFYSALSRAVERGTTTKAPAAQWKATLANSPGVKAEEIEWTGVNDWLDMQSGPVTKQQVAEYLDGNGVKIEETVKGAPAGAEAEAVQRKLLPMIEEKDRIDRQMAPYFDAAGKRNLTPKENDEITALVAKKRELEDNIEVLQQMGKGDMPELKTKWSSYTLPGGENYRELLLKMPVAKELAFDPSKVKFNKKQSSATQGGVQVSYDGKDIGTFDLFTRDESGPRGAFGQSVGQQRPRTDDEIINIARKYYERGNSQMNIKPLRDGTYESSHWDEPNVLAHIRFKERTSADGKRVLAIEEIQSDWHQAGRDKGYQAELTAGEKRLQEFNARSWGAGKPVEDAEMAEWKALKEKYGESLQQKVKGVPNAPFKNNAWASLSLKRMIRWAAENDFDEIAWVPGDIPVERFSLSHTLGEVTAAKTPDGRVKFSISNGRRDARQALQRFGEADGGDVVMTREQAVEAFGKDAGSRMFDQTFEAGESFGQPIPKRFAGDDLNVGGEGMRAFYDKILVNEANKLGKKYGAQVGRTEIEHDWIKGGPDGMGREISDFYSLPITPELKKQALGGQTLMGLRSIGPEGAGAAIGGVGGGVYGATAPLEDANQDGVIDENDRQAMIAKYGMGGLTSGALAGFAGRKGMGALKTGPRAPRSALQDGPKQAGFGAFGRQIGPPRPPGTKSAPSALQQPNNPPPSRKSAPQSQAEQQARDALKKARSDHTKARKRNVMNNNRDALNRPFEEAETKAAERLQRVMDNDARLKTITARGRAIIESPSIKEPLMYGVGGASVLGGAIVGASALMPKERGERPMSPSDPAYYWSNVVANKDKMIPVQLALREWGEWPDDTEATGMYGKTTKAAIKAWRYDRGLDPDAPMTKADTARLLAGPKGYQDRDGKTWRYGTDGQRVAAP